MTRLRDYAQQQLGFKIHCGLERMGRRERLATPIPFRDLLLSMARSVYEVDPHTRDWRHGQCSI